jgi:hypothetical protein
MQKPQPYGITFVNTLLEPLTSVLVVLEGNTQLENKKEVKKMADYSMTDAKWTKNKNKILGFMETTDLGGMAQVITWNLETGDNDADNRKRYWGNITNLFGMVPNSPIRRGREPSLPDEVQNTVNTVVAQYESDCAAFYDAHPQNAQILRQHGKSGYGAYDDGADYGESQGSSLRSTLAKAYRNHVKIQDGETVVGLVWDGTLDNDGVPTITVSLAESGDDSTAGGEEE